MISFLPERSMALSLLSHSLVPSGRSPEVIGQSRWRAERSRPSISWPKILATMLTTAVISISMPNLARAAEKIPVAL